MTALAKVYIVFDFDHRIRLAKWYGKRHGLKGNVGGWIYATDAKGMPVGDAIAQGWLKLYFKRRRAIWAELNGQEVL